MLLEYLPKITLLLLMQGWERYGYIQSPANTTQKKEPAFVGRAPLAPFASAGNGEVNGVGGDLLSRLFRPVPSAQRGLTALFGMGRGEHPRSGHHCWLRGRMRSLPGIVTIAPARRGVMNVRSVDQNGNDI